ncbi:hypothetical protein M427DRAFT_57458 [Gonapodya prolifera JEL478]|uniref:Uncharacterized protein n=1 Tax=Gonapodya prolifera (strain JEL478) TaxID=1344416 RepID=A0A139AD83_GONPJ|nr:hypothetical protein M427DRAFT_57458 [Gonapodya prolifera JEL478]|eukprot:KXS14544.1 hypothetical protein M427DRAFT_57458 [Gonapodya prolifera JEL478]
MEDLPQTDTTPTQDRAVNDSPDTDIAHQSGNGDTGESQPVSLASPSALADTAQVGSPAPKPRKKRKKRKVKEKSDTEEEEETFTGTTRLPAPSPNTKTLRANNAHAASPAKPTKLDDGVKLLALASSTSRVATVASVIIGEEELGSDEEGDRDYQYGEEREQRGTGGAKRRRTTKEAGHKLGGGTPASVGQPSGAAGSSANADAMAERRRLSLEAAERRAKAAAQRADEQ